MVNCREKDRSRKHAKQLEFRKVTNNLKISGLFTPFTASNYFLQQHPIS